MGRRKALKEVWRVRSWRRERVVVEKGKMRERKRVE